MTQPPSDPGSPAEGSVPDPSAPPFVPPAPPGSFPPPPADFPPPAQSFPPPPAGNYPPPAGNFPPPGGNYPPPPGGNFPPPGGGYPPPPAGNYPPPAGNYPPPGGNYPPPAGNYPPPGGGYPPPPPGNFGSQAGFPGQGGGAPMSVDLSKVGNGDWIVVGLGVLLVIFSFFGWLSVSASFLGISQNESTGGWHRFWFLAPLLIVAITVIRVVQLLTGSLVKEVKPLWLLYAALGAFVVYIISLIDIFVQSPSSSDLGFGSGDLGSGVSFSAGPGFGIWASIILVLAFIYFLALSLQKRGQKLPMVIPGPNL